MAITTLDPDAIIAALGLAPHPEGGWYRETFRDSPAGGGRGALTQIYYLLRKASAPAGTASTPSRSGISTRASP